MKGKLFKVSYNRGMEVIKITIEDTSGRKIDTFSFNGDDEKSYNFAIKRIFEKYGFRPTIDLNQSVNQKEKDLFSEDEELKF